MLRKGAKTAIHTQIIDIYRLCDLATFGTSRRTQQWISQIRKDMLKLLKEYRKQHGENIQL